MGCQASAGKHGTSPAPCHRCVATHSAANRRSCPRPGPHVPKPAEPAQGITHPRTPGQGCGHRGWQDAPRPPAAAAGTHRRRNDAGFNYRSTDGEGVSDAGGRDAVVPGAEPGGGSRGAEATRCSRQLHAAVRPHRCPAQGGTTACRKPAASRSQQLCGQPPLRCCCSSPAPTA